MYKYIIIGFLLASIVGLVSIFIYPIILGQGHDFMREILSPTDRGLTLEEKYLEGIKESVKKKEVNTTLFNEAIKKDDISICGAITDPEVVIQCTDQLTIKKAVSNNNPAVCGTLSGSISIKKCENEVLYSLSLSAGDRTLCERISDEKRKGTCLEEVSQILFKTMSFSGELTDTSCDILVGGAYDACLAEFRKEKDSRVYELATKTSNIALCTSISGDDIRLLCQDTIRLKLALSSENALLCKSISSEEKRSICEKQFDRANLISLYKSIITSADIEKCDTLSDKKLAHQCHDVLLIDKIRMTGNTARCDELFNTGSTLACKSMYVLPDTNTINSDSGNTLASPSPSN